MKKKVKILDSIAGLADPKPASVLDAKYEVLRAKMLNREKPAKPAAIEEAIRTAKLADRYREAPLGFSRDWSFRPGEEVMIDAELAKKWEAAGLCLILEDSKKAA